MTLTITQEGDTLFAQATGQGKFEVQAIARLAFRAKQLNIKLVFNPSSTNPSVMDSLELHQAGMVMKAIKVK